MNRGIDLRTLLIRSGFSNIVIVVVNLLKFVEP